MQKNLIIQNIIKTNNLLLIVLVICFSWQFSLWYEFIIEDTYISLVYVKNMLQGQGLTYNGIVVEGFSNLLWVIVVYFFSLPLGDPLLAAKVAGFIFGLYTLYLLPKLGHRLTNSFLPGFFAGLMLTLDFSFMAWIVGGLETALLSALLILTLYQIYRQGKPLLIGILVGLIAMTRPEGFGFLPLLLMGDGLIHRDKRRIVSILASFSFVFVLFLTWRFFRYGELLPVTVYAKGGSLTNQYVAGRVYLWQFLRAYRIPLTIGLISMIGLLVEFVHAPGVLLDWSLGLSKERLKQAFLFLPLLLVLVGYSIFIVMAGGDWMPVFRFFAPLMPLVYLSITGLLFLATQRAPTFIFYSLIMLLLLRQLLFLPTVRSDVIARGQDTVTKLEKFGQWLQVNSAPTDVVAVLDAGAIPYYSGLKTIDIFGLNDAHIAHLPGGMGQKIDVDYILSHEPEFIEIHITRSQDGFGWIIIDHLGSAHLYYAPEFHKWYDFVEGIAPFPHFRRLPEARANSSLDDYYNVEFQVAPMRAGRQNSEWCTSQYIPLRVMIRNAGTGVWAASELRNDIYGYVQFNYQLQEQTGETVTTGTLPLPRDLAPNEEESVILRLPPIHSAGSYTLNLDLELFALWTFSSKRGNDYAKVPIKIKDCQ